jgi:capsular polysaccharide biosynthesis protein
MSTVGDPPQAEMRGATVNHEGLIFRRGRIQSRSFVREFDAAHYRRPSRYLAFLVRNYLSRRAIRVPDGNWVIDNFSPNSYFHWMTECLPRLLVAERVGASATLLLPKTYREERYVAFTLAAFPFIKTVRWIEQGANLAVDRLICPPRLAPAGFYSPELVEVAARVRARVRGDGARRLYLRRGEAARRQVTNEAAVARMLETHGFQALRINPADPAHQIRAARSAEVIVGVHGAELTNIIFQRPGAQVVELRHRYDDQFFDCYSRLAESFGVGYQALPCDLSPGKEAIQNAEEINHADLLVDIEALDEMIATAVSNAASRAPD